MDNSGLAAIGLLWRRILPLTLVATGFATASASGAILPYLEEFTGVRTSMVSQEPPLPAPAEYWIYNGYRFNARPLVYDAQPFNDPAGDPSFGPGGGAQDGALSVEGSQDLNVLVSNLNFTFPGTIVPGEQYTFDIMLFQSSSSFPVYQIDLLVDSDSVGNVAGQIGTAGHPRTINYTATAADAGKTLGFFLSNHRNAGGASARLGIDWVQLSVVPIPEPASMISAAMALFATVGVGAVRRQPPRSPN